MSDPQTLIADDLQAALLAYPLTEPCEVVVRRVPIERLEDLDTLRLTITPGRRVRTPEARHDDLCEYEIHVLIQQKLTATAETADGLRDRDDFEIQELCELIDDLEQYLSGWRPTRVVVCLRSMEVGAADGPPWSVAELRGARVFRAVLTMNYEMIRTHTV